MTDIKKIKIMVLGLMLVVFSSGAYAQDKVAFNSIYKHRSESNAFLWSLSGIVVPIAGGLLWWSLDGPDKETVTDSFGSYSWSYTRIDSPNRTIPITLILSGVFLGPSLGYFYGDIPKRGLKGFAIRGGVMLGSLAIGSSMGLDICIFGNSDCDDDGWVVVGLGALFVVVHSIYDIVVVPFAVREHNRSLQSASMTLLPKYFADSKAGGLELKITF